MITNIKITRDGVEYEFTDEADEEIKQIVKESQESNPTKLRKIIDDQS